MTNDDLLRFASAHIERIRAKARIIEAEPLSPAEADMLRCIVGLTLVAEKLTERVCVPATTEELSALVLPREPG